MSLTNAVMMASQGQALLDLPTTMLGLQAELARRVTEIAQLRQQLYGKRGEKMKPVADELTQRQATGLDPKSRQARARERRQAAATAKRALPTVDIQHPVDAAAQRCVACDGRFRDLGEGEKSFEMEYRPGRLVRKRHIRQKRVCQCGDTIVVAPAPARVEDGVTYGPGFHAHVAVSKCADSLPLYRQAKRMKREGLDISPSTLGDIFHRTASCCRPIYDMIVEEVANSGQVNADETPLPVQAKDKTRRAYIWTFIGAGHVSFVYSPTRSGETPGNVLGGRHGYLQVDAYSGYNKICAPEGWTRLGCLAHVRRNFFNAQLTAPEAAKEALERILSIYAVEYEAAALGIVGTTQHRDLRQRKCRPLFASFHGWLQQQQPRHPPKSPMGKAITYALNAWASLLVYLEDPNLKPDNNAAEGALRAVALGRKNFLFVGNDVAGENLAILQTVIATCQSHGVDPQAYLTDVLIRIQTHPAARKRELLPDQWQTLFSG